MYILLMLLSHSVLTPEQMEKQFAVKGPPVKALPNVYRQRPLCTSIGLTKGSHSGATHDHILGNT